MTEFDYIVLAVVGFSGLLGFIRGFIKEAFSLIAYVAAGYAAVMWGPRAYPWFASMIEHHLVSLALAYAVVFIAVLLIVGIINLSLSSLISITGLGPADRGLGLLFGLARGVLLVIVVVILAGYTSFPLEPWWQNARFSPAAVNAVLYIKSLLPVEIGNYLPY